MDKYNQLTFGVAKEIITPCIPATMSGFGTVYGVPFTDIHDDLFVRTLILKDDDGEMVILLAFDLLFHDDSLVTALREYASKKHNVPSDNLFVSFSHTHFGPTVKGYDHVWHTDEYEEFIFTRACCCIDRAFLNMRRGTMKYATVSGEWNISRRLPLDGDIAFKPNPDGDRDNNLYLLKLEDESGSLRALAMNFACHPSNLSAIASLSSEYPGRLCQRVEAEFFGCTAIFFQGFGSDTKLKIGATKRLGFSAISYADCDEVALGMTQKIKARLIEGGWKSLPVRLGAKAFSVKLPLDLYPRSYYEERKTHFIGNAESHFVKTPGDINNTSKNYANLMWGRIDYVLDNYDTLPDELTLTCGAIRINPDFYILSMGGEPGCDIARVLREAFPDKQLVCFGYGNAIAYVPSDKMVSEGGYEAGKHSVEEYRLKGSIRSGVNEKFISGYSDAIKSIENR